MDGWILYFSYSPGISASFDMQNGDEFVHSRNDYFTYKSPQPVSVRKCDILQSAGISHQIWFLLCIFLHSLLSDETNRAGGIKSNKKEKKRTYKENYLYI